MRLTPDIERTLRRYALGDLEEELRPELEELLITDSDAFEALGVIEDELIEDYLEETGSPAERRSLERHLLSRPDGLRRLRLARALRERASLPVTSPAKETSPVGGTGGQRVPPTRWRPAWAGLAAALAASLLGNVWQASLHSGTQLAGIERASRHPSPPSTSSPSNGVAAENQELRARLATAESERLAAEAHAEAFEAQLERIPAVNRRLASPSPSEAARAQPSMVAAAAPAPPVPTPTANAWELRESFARERRGRIEAEARANALEKQLQATRAPVVTFTLATGLLRGGGSLPRLAIPKDAVVVRLRLELARDDYPRYRATLLDANGDELWTASQLRAEGQQGHATLVFLVPAEHLHRGDYQVRVSGSSDGGVPEPVETYAFGVGDR